MDDSSASENIKTSNKGQGCEDFSKNPDDAREITHNSAGKNGVIVPGDIRADVEDGYKGRIKKVEGAMDRQKEEKETVEDGRINGHGGDGISDKRKAVENDVSGGDGGGGGGKVIVNVISGKHPDAADLDAEAEAVISDELQDALSQTWHAPDGGWGWVVVVAAMVLSLIVDGLTYTFGLFLGQFEKAFKAPKSTIALASSLQVGIYLLIGPIVSALTNRFGCRPVIVVGSFIAGLAYVVSSWSVNVTMLILTYGVFGGIGFGLMYLPAIVAVSVYFEEKRAIATGIAVCGSGIGTFILAPLTDLLLDEYNWSWTILILGGIVFNGMVFGALVRPLDFDPTVNKKDDDDDDDDDDDNKKDDDKEEAITKKSGGRDDEEAGFLKKARKRKKTTSSSSTRSEDIPMITVTDEMENTTVMHSEVTDKLEPGGPTNLFFSSTPNMVINSVSLIPKAKKGNKRSRTTSFGSSDHHLPRHRFNTMDAYNRAHSLSNDSKSSHSRARAHAPLGLAIISLSDAHLNKIRDDVQLPLSRRDINLSGSLAHHDWIHKMYKGEKGRGLYVQSIRSITSVAMDGTDNISRKTGGLWACLPPSARETLEEMLDFSILKDRRYWFVLLGNFFCMIGFYVPFVYIPDMAKTIGVGEEKAAFLLSIIGITNTIGRVMTGVFMHFFDIDCTLVSSGALFIAGVVTVLSPLCYNYIGLAVVSAIFGVCVAAFISLCSVLLCDLLGVENLTNAFGFVILFRGVACIVGPPIAGAIIDSTGVFDPAFYVGGGMIILGAVTQGLLLSPCIHSSKKKS